MCYSDVFWGVIWRHRKSQKGLKNPFFSTATKRLACSLVSNLAWFARAGKVESALAAAEVAKVELPLAQYLKAVINFHVPL